MRKPTGGEIAGLVGALGAGVVAGHEIKKEAEVPEVQRAEAHRQNALNFVKNLRIMSTGPMVSANCSEIISLGEHKGDPSHKIFVEPAMSDFDKNLRTYIEASSEWIDTPIAPEILNLLEQCVDRIDKTEPSIDYRIPESQRHSKKVPALEAYRTDDVRQDQKNKIAKLRKEYTERWGGLQDAFRK